jgi:Tfp pilus assembly protein PilF
MPIQDQISAMLQSLCIHTSMKYFLSFSIALIVVFNVVEIAPTNKDTQIIEKNALQAALIKEPEKPQETRNISTIEKNVIITLLDLYVERKRDLPKAAAILDQQNINEVDSKILKLYEAKILARSLDFETALILINKLKHEDLALLKAAVLISLDDRDKAQSYLYEVLDTHRSAYIKSTVLTLLKIYQDHDMHRDADESYLWILFAKQFSKIGEKEISQYLVNKTLSLSPEYRDAWLIKGMNELSLREYKNAESSLLSAYQSDPGNVQIQYLLGHTYFLQGNFELSEQYFLYSLNQDSSYKEDTLMKLGEIAIKKEDPALAAHYFEQLRVTKPKHATALSQLIWLYGEPLAQPNTALELAEIRQSAYPDDPQSAELLRWILSKLGELEEAEKYL